MLAFVVIALIGIPLMEIWVFIEVGGRIGATSTIAIIFLTGIAGALLLRIQGLGVLMRARQTMQQGLTPVAEVVDGVCLIIAGLVLLTPGFVTDAIGAVLFIPPVRRVIAYWALGRVRARHGAEAWAPGRGPTTIDAVYEEIPNDPNVDDPGRKPKAGDQNRDPWTRPPSSS